MIYYALPRLKFRADEYDQRRGTWAFWLMTLGMMGMVLATSAAAVVQIYMERIAGLPFMEVQSYLGLFYAVRFWSGVAMAIGVVLFLIDVLALKPKEEKIPRMVEQPAA
jgi:nitric oxide reductase subunit B